MNDTEYLMTKMVRAFRLREGRDLTDLETQFMTAAAHDATDLCHATCDVARMKALLKQQPSLLDTVGSAALLMAACYFGTHDAVLFLMDCGVKEFYDAQTGLYRKEIAEPIHKAFYHGNFKTLTTVFEAGISDASVITTSHVGHPADTSLLYWAASKPLEYAEFALKWGADPEAPISGNGERGTTVLQHGVAPPTRHEFVELLLADGAYYDIFSACGRGDLDRVRELVGQDPAAVLERGEADMTPLHWAVRGGSLRIAKWLLSRAADVDAETVTRRTALHLAAESGHADMIWLLAGHGADLDRQDHKGRTALHRATYNGQVDIAESLIVLGANPSLKTRTGKTALQSAQLECKFLKPGQ
jgi:hypothetical protein